MDEQAVRDRAEAFVEALVAGDIDRAIGSLSDQLRRNVGEVLALLPLPVSEGSIASIDHGGSSYSARLRLVGETEEVEIDTRWKERDGTPVIIEASHLSRSERAPADGEEALELDVELPSSA
jgi:hypothetical protein